MHRLVQNKIGIYFFVIVLILTVGYTYYQTKSFTRGPILEITEPLNGSLLNSSLINIKGYTKNISYISINGRQVFVDEEGFLNEKILLSEGYNIIRVLAEDKYERKVEEKLELVYKQKIES